MENRIEYIRANDISLETAILAKSKGFLTELEEVKRNSFYFVRTTTTEDSEEFVIVLQCELQKWLREVHGIHVNPVFLMQHETYAVEVDWKSKDAVWFDRNFEEYDTYEAAFEIGLQEGLKLIV